MTTLRKMTTFRTALCALSLTATVLLTHGADAAERPNIILIMADDLGAECLGSYGSASYQTPRLDRMAGEGMRFTHAHSMPLCTPSRVALMTGRYNSRNYISFGALAPGETTFADYLKASGYATGVTGKWQLDGEKKAGAAAGTHPEEAGFDEYLLWHYIKRGERYADPEFKRKGEAVKIHEGAYGPDLLNDFALDFIERHQGGPFFLYYPMCLVHDPFVPTPDSKEWAEGDRKKEDLKHFPEMVARMDAMVGKVLDKVDALGLAERTLVLFTGDNGTNRNVTSRMVDGREIAGGKGLTLDTGTHVPLIARWTGSVPTGAVNVGLVCFEDFLPTLAEVGGAALPQDAGIDGRSFLAQLRGATEPSRDWIYVPYNPLNGKKSTLVRYARGKEWKLYGDGRLYNVLLDPAEQSPLPPGEAAAERAALQAVLDSQP